MSRFVKFMEKYFGDEGKLTCDCTISTHVLVICITTIIAMLAALRLVN